MLIASGRSRELKRDETPAPDTQVRRDLSQKPRPTHDDRTADYLFEPSDDTASDFDDGDDDSMAQEAVDQTPAWLASARKLAGVEEVLR